MNLENIVLAEETGEDFTLFKSDNGKYGFKDRYGNIVIEPKYINCGPFYDGLARVQSEKTQKWGAVNINGIEVVPCKFDNTLPHDPIPYGLEKGTFQIEAYTEGVGFIYYNKNGEEIDLDKVILSRSPILRQIKRIYDFAERFSNYIKTKVR